MKSELINMREPHISIMSAFWKLTPDLNWPELVKRQRLSCKVGEQTENENCRQIAFFFCLVRRRFLGDYSQMSPDTLNCASHWAYGKICFYLVPLYFAAGLGAALGALVC